MNDSLRYSQSEEEFDIQMYMGEKRSFYRTVEQKRTTFQCLKGKLSWKNCSCNENATLLITVLGRCPNVINVPGNNK